MDDGFSIGIIGGKGKMGHFFANLFSSQGYQVLVSDIGTDLTNKDLVKACKVIFISVPVSAFEKVVKEISDVVEKRHWIIDVCSLKSEPVKVMKKYLSEPEILATHPLFGPFEKDLRGKTIAFWSVRGKSVLNWFIEEMQKHGLRLVRVPPKKHDKIMALVQVLNHFWLIILANLIKKSGLDLKEVISLSTPTFLQQLEVLKRFARQNPEVYEKIQLENPWGKNLRKLFCQTCRKLLKGLDSEEASEIFESYFTTTQELARELEVLLDEVFPNQV